MLEANLDWTTYKERCNQPDAWSRWMLVQSLELLGERPGLATLLRSALAGAPLTKPPGHKGGAATDMLVLNLDAAAAQAIAERVEQAAAHGVESSGTRGRGLGGFSEAWREYSEFINQQQRETEQMSEARNLVLELIEAFNRIDMEAVIDSFTEDAVYHNIPMEAAQGKAAIRSVLTQIMGDSEEVQWDVLNIADEGGVVLTERVDKFKVNGVWAEIPVMGVFEVSGGKVAAWRDYFDMGQVQAQFAATVPSEGGDT